MEDTGRVKVVVPVHRPHPDAPTTTVAIVLHVEIMHATREIAHHHEVMDALDIHLHHAPTLDGMGVRHHQPIGLHALP